MSQQVIGVGTVADDHTGDPGRTAFQKVNANFLELYQNTPVISVQSFGALGDAVTDDYAAFVAALAAGPIVYIPPTASGYRLSAGITIPGGVTMYSTSFLPGNPVVGARLIFDLSVATCLTLGGASSTNQTAGAFGFCITRAAGTVPASSVGILVQNLYNVIMSDLGSFRSAINWNFVEQSVYGISAHCSNLHSGAATDVHWQFDGWSEFHCNGGRTGMNGAGDFTTASHIRIQGGSGSGGSGPNGIRFVNHQFNQGSNTAVNWLVFNHPANPGGNAVEYTFIGCHVEGVSGAGITSDASTTLISRLQISECSFSISGVPFFALNAATGISALEMSNNHIFASTFTLAPTPQIAALSIHSNRIGAAGSITATAAGSTASFHGNSWTGGVTFAGPWASLTVDGDMLLSGSLSLTATGNLSVNMPGNYIVFTPGVAFGGGTTGITYTRQLGRYQYLNNRIVADVSIILSSKGSSGGAATITGLPATSTNLVFASGPTTTPTCSNMTGLTGAVKASIATSSTVATLTQSAATGDVAITDTSFTNTSTLHCTFNYPT